MFSGCLSSQPFELSRVHLTDTAGCINHLYCQQNAYVERFSPAQAFLAILL